MELALKNQIREASLQYINDKGLTQDVLAEKSKLNPSYISSILNGKWEVMSTGNKVVPIADKWFVQLADVVGVQVEKVFWKYFETKQSQGVKAWLNDAKDKGISRTIICNTRMGKTEAVNEFMHYRPKHTYLITVNSLMRLHDIINIMCNLLNIPLNNSKAMKLSAIIIKFRDIKRSGGNPMIIFDEGENMEYSVLKMIKGLYDGIEKYCGIVLIGTDQLIKTLERLRDSNKVAGPQLYYRLEPGFRRISNTVDFEPFYSEFVPDKGLRKLLNELCKNYGQLNKYLEPALREAYERGMECNEDFFRLMYNMPR